jgi:hypothetical protein
MISAPSEIASGEGSGAPAPGGVVDSLQGMKRLKRRTEKESCRVHRAQPVRQHGLRECTRAGRRTGAGQDAAALNPSYDPAPNSLPYWNIVVRYNVKTEYGSRQREKGLRRPEFKKVPVIFPVLREFDQGLFSCLHETRRNCNIGT